MKILITGGAGFIGSHLASALLGRGNSVSVLDDLSTGSFANIHNLVSNPRFRFAIDKVENRLVLDRMASESDAVVHLAAAVGVQLIVEKPTATIETNVMGTHAVLEAARRYRCRIIVASTSEVYGKSEKVPFSEEHDIILGPSIRSRWSYAASKLVDEFLTLAIHREHSLPATVIRLFNTVGPRQTGRYGMVLPRFVRNALHGKPLQVYGDGKQTRCFCHVADVVKAIIDLLDQPEIAAGQIFNVGSQEEVSIENLARLVVKLSNSNSRIVYVPYDEAYGIGFEDMQRRVPDITKIFQAIGWKSNCSLEEAILDVIDYERKLMDNSAKTK